jgi:hypothetical protein
MKFPAYEINEAGSIRHGTMLHTIGQRTIADPFTGAKTKKVTLLSVNGYNVEAFVSELHRAAWPEVYDQQPTKIHVPGLSGLPGRLAA